MTMRNRLAKKVAALFSVVIIWVPLSANAVDVANAQIDRIGLINPSEIRGAMIQLTDLSNNPAWTGSRQFFLSRSILGAEGLAMALTAFSMGRPIWVRIVGTGEPLSLITVIYVNAN